MVARPRNPWTAAVLSLLCTGLGHLYCGRPVLGALLLVTAMASLPISILVALVDPGPGPFAALLLAVGAAVTAYLFAVIHSAYLAHRLEEGYQLRRYNRPGLYLALALGGLIYPLVGASLVRQHYLEAFTTSTASMAPALQPGDRFLINKAAYRRRGLMRGDIIVFRGAVTKGAAYVKRLIGLPGDTIAVRSGMAYVNGRPLGTPYEDHDRHRYRVQGTTSDSRAVRVPAGHCFVLGDNREHAVDSRDLGAVPLTDVLGPLQYLYYSREGWSRVGTFREL